MTRLPIPPTVLRFLLGGLLCLVALNQRGAMTSMGPVLPEIMHSTALSAGWAGVLTTVPVLCLGLFAPIAPILSRRLGTDRALLVLMLVLALGCIIRLQGSALVLGISGVLIGAPIGMSNVLVPAILKRDFADRTALMTGLYSMTLCTSAGLGSGITVPMERALGGWPAALAVWSVPALLAALALTPRAWKSLPARVRAIPVRGLWGNRLAWQVALLIGMQSTFTYILFAWLPPLLRDRGMDPMAAGLVTSVGLIGQMISSLGGPVLANRARDQRPAIIISLLLMLGGFYACFWGPLSWEWGMTFIMGLGQGSVFAVALMVIVLRSPDARIAAELSGMAQTIGYLAAGAGPMLVGVLHDALGGWWVLPPLMTAITLVCLLAGLGAGRNRFVAVAA